MLDEDNVLFLRRRIVSMAEGVALWRGRISTVPLADGSMNYEHLSVEREDAVATVSLAHPDARNAPGAGLIEELGKDDGVRVVVLTGEGDYFCAGAEATEITARRIAELRVGSEGLGAFLEKREPAWREEL